MRQCNLQLRDWWRQQRQLVIGGANHKDNSSSVNCAFEGKSISFDLPGNVRVSQKVAGGLFGAMPIP